MKLEHDCEWEHGWELNENYGDLHDGKQMMMMKMKAKTLIGVALLTLTVIDANCASFCDQLVHLCDLSMNEAYTTVQVPVSRNELP